MAALKPIRDYPAAETPTLSRHEVACLFQRLLECDELLQLAILGADAACSRAPCGAHRIDDLVAIRRCLEVAQTYIAEARASAGHLGVSAPVAAGGPVITRAPKQEVRHVP